MDNLEDLLARPNTYLEASISFIQDIRNYSDPIALDKSFFKALKDENVSIEDIYKGSQYGAEIKNLTAEQRGKLEKKIDDYKKFKRGMQHALPSICDLNWNKCYIDADKIFMGYFAVEIISDFKKRELTDAEKLNGTGEQFYNVGKYSEALEFFNASIKKSPRFILAWVNKGMALKNLSKIDEAIACYDHIINNLDQYNKRAWGSKADAFLIKRDLESANECVKRLTEIDPNYQFAKLLKLRLGEFNKNNFNVDNIMSNVAI